MTNYTRIIVNLSTGQQEIVPLTPEEIFEIENRAPEPVQVPQTVTPRQVRLLLLQQGLLSQVQSMIEQQDEATRITWEYALEFQRNDPLLNQLGTNLGLTSEQIDQFFIAAAQL